MTDHLSYSSISTWLMCPRSWKFRYVEKQPAPTSTALIFGSAFHKTIEAFLTRGTSEPLEAIWCEQWTAKVDEESGIAWGSDTTGDLNAMGIKMFSDNDIVETIESLKPVEHENVERFVELRVPGVPIPVVGYIDLIDNGIPCDFKTASRKWSANQATDEIQPLFYLAALNQAGSSVMQFRHYIFTKTKAPAIQIFDTHRTMSEIVWLFGLIGEVWQAIEKGVCPPNPGTWKCSEKFCEYWSICRGK